MILLFKILIIIGAVFSIFYNYKIGQFINGEKVSIPGFEFHPDINIEGISDETASKLKKILGWGIVVISDLIELFKLYVVLFLI